MSEVPLQFVPSSAGDYLEKFCSLDINSCPNQIRLTKIIATIGPRSRDLETLEKLFEKGINIARINLITGIREYHTQTLKNVRIALENYSKKIGRPYPLAIGICTKGPSVLSGMLLDGPLSEVVLEKGDVVKLTIDKAYENKCTAQIIFINYPNLTKVVKVGYHVYIDNGLISLICTSIHEKFIICYVEYGGKLGSYKGINLPAVNVDLPYISEQDKEDIKFAVDNNIDIIFASFIRDAKNLAEIRTLLGERGKKIMLVAKVENHQAMDNLEEIIQAADGVLIGRIDLGIEFPIEKLFIAQKNITAKCNVSGKPVVCAAQLLLSMVKHEKPTKAEITDVANAVLDGVDCLSLSVETSDGDYPVTTVEVMSNICKEAEGAMWQKKYFTDLIDRVKSPIDPSHCIAICAVRAATQCSATAIVVVTTTGRSARLVSRYRPACPIIAVSRDPQIVRHCLIYRAILPIQYEYERVDDWSKDMEARINYGIDYGKDLGLIRCGDPVIAISGWKKGSGLTNTLRVIHVSEYSPPVIV